MLYLLKFSKFRSYEMMFFIRISKVLISLGGIHAITHLSDFSQEIMLQPMRLPSHSRPLAPEIVLFQDIQVERGVYSASPLIPTKNYSRYL